MDVSGKDRRVIASPPCALLQFPSVDTHGDLWESPWLATVVRSPSQIFQPVDDVPVDTSTRYLPATAFSCAVHGPNPRADSFRQQENQPQKLARALIPSTLQNNQ